MSLTFSDPPTPAADKSLCVWHIPQVPMHAFFVPVDSLDQAIHTLTTLWAYDEFQFTHHVKPDYSNASGLLVFEDDQWGEWHDDDGNDICEIIQARSDTSKARPDSTRSADTGQPG